MIKNLLLNIIIICAKDVLKKEYQDNIKELIDFD